MIRGTLANIRLRNQMVPGTEGGMTRWLRSSGAGEGGAGPGEEMSIYDAAKRYEADGVPLVILAGKEYGSGSSRDWAAKGTALLGVRAVLAESFERIHRSNLVGMGILPLQYVEGDTAASLGLSGDEVFDVTGLEGIAEGAPLPRELTVTVAGGASQGSRSFAVVLRIDTPKEEEYYRHGGILPYVLRALRSG
jgi:aconitate hydratase